MLGYIYQWNVPFADLILGIKIDRPFVAIWFAVNQHCSAIAQLRASRCSATMPFIKHAVKAFVIHPSSIYLRVMGDIAALGVQAARRTLVSRAFKIFH